jgi:hypothetical protein
MANCGTLVMALEVMRGFSTYGMAIGTVAVENGEVSNCLNIGGAQEFVVTTSDLNELQFRRDR